MASVEGLTKVGELIQGTTDQFNQEAKMAAAKQAAELFKSGKIGEALSTILQHDPDRAAQLVQTFQAYDPATQGNLKKAETTAGLEAETAFGTNKAQLQDKQLATQKEIAQMEANASAAKRAEADKEKASTRGENWASNMWQKVTISQPFKDFQEFKVRQGTLENAATNPSAFGDIGTVFAFMKTLDPRSVVRESEYATAAEAGSLLTRAKNYITKAEKGERLTPEQRQDILMMTRHLGSVYKDNYDAFLEPVKKQAKNRGVDIDLIDPYNVDVNGEPTIKSGKLATSAQAADAIKKVLVKELGQELAPGTVIRNKKTGETKTVQANGSLN